MKVIGNLTKDAIIRALVSEGSSATEAVGSESVFESAASFYVVPVYDSNENKTVIFYMDGGNSYYATAIVSTLSGTSLSYGSPVVFNNAPPYYMKAAFDSNSNKIVVVYQDDGSGPGKAIVGTVSGTSISFGSEVTFNASVTTRTSIVFDSNSNKVVIAYRDHGNNNYGTGIVGTVSGTSISFGSPTVFESGTVDYINPCFDSNLNKVVVAYQDFSNSSRGTAVVGTVSGTSISFGTPVVFETGASAYCESAFDSDTNKVVIGYYDGGNSYYGTAIVGTVSGTSISFGTAVVYQSSQANTYGIVYDSTAKKIILFYRDQDNSAKGTFISGTVSGTSITFGDKTVAADGSTEYGGVTFDSTNRTVVVGFQDEGNSDYGTALAYRVGYTSATGGTIADGKPVIVNANGTVSSVSQTAASLGTEGAFNSETSSNFAAVFDSSNNKHIIVYRWHDGSSTTMRYVVATVASDGSVSFGTDAVVESSDNQQISACFDSTNNRIVVAYRRGADSDHGYALVGSLSGTTVTWGSPTEFQNGLAKQIDLDFDSTSGKVVIAFAGTSEYGTAIVGTVSGTSISFGSPVVHRSARSQDNRVVYDSTNNKTVIGFMDQDDGEFGKAVVGTVSGTSISFGSAVTFHSGEMNRCGGTFDSANGKVVFVYSNKDNSQRVTAIVGTVSGTSISFGSAVVVATDGTYGEAAPDNVVFDSNSNKVIAVLPYTVSGSYSNRGFVFPLSVSGTTIVADTGTDFAGATAVSPAISFDSNVNKSLISFGDGGNSEYATAVSFAPLSGNLTSENFVGIMKGAALDGTNGEILSSCSIARNQTSLTPGQTYFVTGTGTLSTTAGSPSVTAGTAISSKELIVKG